MSNWKDMIIHLIAGLMQLILYKWYCQYLPKPFELFGGDINIKFDLSNYATKTCLKHAIGINTFKLAANSHLVSLKAEVNNSILTN